MARGRRIPWARAEFVVRALDLDVEEWRSRWESVYTKDRLEKGSPRGESSAGKTLEESVQQEEAQRVRRKTLGKVPPAEPSAGRRAGLVRLMHGGLIAVCTTATIWLGTDGLTNWPSTWLTRHDARQYKVTAFGHVVDKNGRGFADVEPGDVFLQDPSGEGRRIQGRYYGTIPSRHITGYVRINKPAPDETCP